MECNKEEAIRAKCIAESRMQNKDFEGARKIALKAQNLFPDLESISQILAVCNVHCAAGTKFGCEVDWYSVLQVELMANESTIKKQYRKLALLLHPDKNKFIGAEDAFHLVGDAYKILSDPAKRSLHDVRRRANFNRVSINQPVQQPYRTSAKKQPGPGVSAFSGFNKDPKPEVSSIQTFWTICPSCSVRFQYYQDVMNKQVRCHKCFNRFVAYDLKTQSVPSAGNFGQPGNNTSFSSQKNECFNDSKVGFQGHKTTDSVPFKPGSRSSTVDGKVDLDSTKANERNFEKVKLQAVIDKDQGGKTTDCVANCTRSKQKQNFSCREDQVAHVESEAPAFKRPRKGEKQDKMGADGGLVRKDQGSTFEEKEDLTNQERIILRSKTSVDIDLTYPAPEFCNFEKEKFVVGQIWALYDHTDGMPRFYALIRKVYGREFKLQLNWLESDPKSIAEMKWCEEELPVACGNFKLGKSFTSMDPDIFSHLMQWRKGVKRNSYAIHPLKGEVWALFKNWDIRWSSDPDNKRVYEFQIVEILKDFTEGAVVSVIRLVRITEYMALFVRAVDAEENVLEIHAKDVFSFSHRIPACRMSGTEGNRIPEGSLELDCACLPSNFAKILASVSLESFTTRTGNNLNSSSICNDQKLSQPTMENIVKPIEQNSQNRPRMSDFTSNGVTGGSEADHSRSDDSEFNIHSQNANSEDATVPSSSLSCEYPDSEFHDFARDKVIEKFDCGQIWAFYSEIDQLPKYYGRIRKVDLQNHKVQVRWLEPCFAVDEDDQGDAFKLLRSCGTFRSIKETFTMHSFDAFSHLVKAKSLVTKDHYSIFPNVGEIWALYKSWSASWSSSDFRNCEFEVVEISECDTSGIKALVLTQVSGYTSVFQRNPEGSESVRVIPFLECMKFSHRIPAYKLEKELGTRGCWELDPAAVPVQFLSPKS
ncbi:Chaperone protein dnaJ 49 [Apostasia shenzhenica]|uniref:Chaperone protein dnaJ 49 n=1 Tax=Apostasia shenzhenica TaxID=1088818 RepID=A0A2I0AZ88_9ASPA|nr:Chaperone protein dnaJ 49 [Apostasia shenzhenica]